MLKFSCPKCGESYEFDDDMVGVKVVCEKCGGRFAIPKNGEESFLIIGKISSSENKNQRNDITEGVEEIYSRAKKLYYEHEYKTAITLFQKAASCGHIYSQYYLGECYLHGNGTYQNLDEAVIWYRKSAKQGNPKAQFKIGWLYDSINNKCLIKNDKEAHKWYCYAAEQGHIYALCNLGRMYEKGQGTPRNMSEAKKCYREAADKGCVQAQFDLGWLYDSENDDNYYDDDEESFKWYERAAHKDHARAQYFLGLAYEHGQGTYQDKDEALEWYEKAADNGDEDAQEKVDDKSWMYDDYDDGYDEDNDDPTQWNPEDYREDAENGDAEAQCKLGLCYWHGTDQEWREDQDYDEACYWFRRAADQDYAEAWYWLGRTCEHGCGPDAGDDMFECARIAIKFYRKASALGFERADEDLERLGY